MKHIASKLFIGFICMAALTVGLLWLIQAVFMKDSYLNERISAVNGAVINASQDGAVDFPQLEEDLNISLIAVDKSGDLIYTSQELPMRGLILRQIPSLINSADGQIRYIQNNTSDVRYAVLGNTLPNGDAVIAVFSLVDVEEASRIILQQLWIITAALFIFSVILAFFLSRMFSRPISEVTKAANELSKGNLEISLPVRTKDEIGRLTAALNNLGSELNKMEKLKRELIANVSHELRSPLSVIQGFAETVRDVTWPDEGKRSSQLTIITQEAKRLSNIVNDILDYSRLQAGVGQIAVSDFNVCRVLEDITSRYEIEAEKKNLSIGLNCKDMAVRFDANRFTQVVNNLLDNAVNHALEGSAVYIDVEESGDAAKISVRNHGTTIPPDDLKHIWDRFYRAERIKGGKSLGTGLGLSIVKSVLERHNVAYGVTSENNETEFWFETQPVL